MTIKLHLISLVIAVLLTIGMASAQTLIAGKVYNSDYSSLIEGASVTVQCNTNRLVTTSLADGTYAVRFNQTECTLGNGVSVTASKGSLSGSGSGVVVECLSGDCNDEYSTVINTAMKETNSGSPVSSGGGSSGGGGRARVYICGNGKCDSGETEVTCARDCKTETNSTACSGTTCLVNNQTEPIALNGTDQVSFGITGASLLWDTLSLPLSLSLSVLAFLIILLIGHKILRYSYPFYI